MDWCTDRRGKQKKERATLGRQNEILSGIVCIGGGDEEIGDGAYDDDDGNDDDDDDDNENDDMHHVASNVQCGLDRLN